MHEDSKKCVRNGRKLRHYKTKTIGQHIIIITLRACSVCTMHSFTNPMANLRNFYHQSIQCLWLAPTSLDR